MDFGFIIKAVVVVLLVVALVGLLITWLGPLASSEGEARSFFDSGHKTPGSVATPFFDPWRVFVTFASPFLPDGKLGVILLMVGGSVVVVVLGFVLLTVLRWVTS